MSRKPVPAQAGQRARAELSFDKPQLLPRLFGEFDANLLSLEERLGVYITARGDRVGIEGSAEAVAHAREVLNELHRRILRGEEVDPGLIDAVIAMSSQPALDGIFRAENGEGAPSIMIRTRKKTIVPRTIAQAGYMRQLLNNDIIFALGPAGTGKTYIAVAQAVAQLITGRFGCSVRSRRAKATPPIPGMTTSEKTASNRNGTRSISKSAASALCAQTVEWPRSSRSCVQNRPTSRLSSTTSTQSGRPSACPSSAPVSVSFGSGGASTWGR